MKKRRAVLLTVGLILVLAVSGGLFALASGEGTASDPLITKSYLEEKFQPSVEALIDEAVAEAAKTEAANLDSVLADYKAQLTAIVDEFNTETGSALENEAYVALLESAINERLMSVEVSASSDTDVFRTVSVASGQTLVCSDGAELFLRSGSAVCVAGLLDVPAGSELYDGAGLEQNTLYISAGEGGGLTASEASSVFIRGSYTLE